MKVQIHFTVDVDASAWADEYGLEYSDIKGKDQLAEVRADVKTYFEGIVGSTQPGQIGICS